MPPYTTFTQIFIYSLHFNPTAAISLCLFVFFRQTSVTSCLVPLPVSQQRKCLEREGWVSVDSALGQPSCQGSGAAFAAGQHLPITYFCIYCIYLPRIYSFSHGKRNLKLVTPSGLESSSSLRDLRSRSQVERVWIREAW